MTPVTLLKIYIYSSTSKNVAEHLEDLDACTQERGQVNHFIRKVVIFLFIIIM